MRLPYFALLVGFSLMPLTASAEMIVNFDFEAGNTGFVSDYAYTPAASVGGTSLANLQYKMTTNPATAHFDSTSFGDHTTGTGLMMMVNGSGIESGTVWGQTIAVTPNTPYSFSAFVASWAGPPQTPQYLLAELGFKINGQLLGNLTAPNAVWTQFSGIWNSGASTTATIQIVESGQPLAGGHDFALDDLSLTAVPEPTSFILLGVSALFCFRRTIASRRLQIYDAVG